MIIGGLQKFSLLDYPEKISAIVFTQGCNFRCQFCYNPLLVWPARAEVSARDRDGKLKYAQKFGRQKDHPYISEDDLFVFLKSRAGKLDAVVITGGEPTRQKDLPEFIKKIKALGYLVKLDTNGSNPEALERLIRGKLIDYLAMDLKAPAAKYAEVAGAEADFNNIKKSVRIIMASGPPAPELRRAGLPYEFRTTIVPELLDQSDIAEMGKIIKGAGLWYLQNFKSSVDLVSKDLQGRVPYNARQMKELAKIGGQFVKKCAVR